MYQAFFKLNRNPFEISPDPRFLFPTEQHQEAVAGLCYGVIARKGFMVLTGEVGTGKTLVIRCLLDRLDQERVSSAYVFNSLLTSQELLLYVAEDLGLGIATTSKTELLLRLGRHFIERHRKGLTTMLIVEEAQHLSPVVLEEIRMLTNLETPQGKSLQVILVGQPELEATLQVNNMRQLRQRVALWFRLHQLGESETQGYVECRLKLAGSKNGRIFERPALERIHFYSQGIPRLINTLCDNAMISAFALGQEQVAPELIEEAASDLGLNQAAAHVPAETNDNGTLSKANSESLSTGLVDVGTHPSQPEGRK